MGSADSIVSPEQQRKRGSDPQVSGLLGLKLPKYEPTVKLTLAPADKAYKTEYANMLALVKTEARQWTQAAAELDKLARLRLGMQEEPRA
jgi:hypothetical protein